MFRLLKAKQFCKRFVAKRESKSLSFTEPCHVIHHIIVFVQRSDLQNSYYFAVYAGDLVLIQKSVENLIWIIEHGAVFDTDPFVVAL